MDAHTLNGYHYALTLQFQTADQRDTELPPPPLYTTAIVSPHSSTLPLVHYSLLERAFPQFPDGNSPTPIEDNTTNRDYMVQGKHQSFPFLQNASKRHWATFNGK